MRRACDLKGTVMQIEKALINDHLRVSKVVIFESNLSVKFAIFFKGSLLFNSFYCPLCLQTKIYGSITQKLK